MRESEIYLIALTAVKEIGPVTIKRIVESFRDPIKAFTASKEELLKVRGVTERVAEEIIRMNPEKTANRIMKEVDEEEIQLMTIYCQSYPPLLREIYDPPPVLYLKGNPTYLKTEFKDDICLGVIGTRHPTPYGKVAAEEIGRSLSAAGITIVSGMARGIDTAAHQAALNEGGRTIAVLGSGLKKLYPKENKKLAKSIMELGAIVSEFPPDTPPFPENFPRRNRIISGLSEAVVVVEAAEKSGALITANDALNQGRDVFSVPGNVTSGKSTGTNNLIREGATPVVSFGGFVDQLPERLTARIQGASTGLKKEPRDTDPPEEAAREMDIEIDRAEEKVLSLLSIDQPMHIDTIAEKSFIRINKLLGSILSLEMKGLVEHLPGNHYIKKIRN